MKLTELIQPLTIAQIQGNADVEITGISMNSKFLQPGELFVCIPGIPGLQEDRHLYVEDAVKAGAAAIVVERDVVSSVPTIQDFLVLVDYAHTPDSLDNALSTLREFADQRIITVFGCGGDRDRTKRPVMGKLAAKHSDHVIITSDNPRTEDPLGILKDIEHGVLEYGMSSESYEMIADRRQAIIRAVDMARSGDIVIIAGKGHETYQILNDQTIHFDDREEAKAAIRNRNH